MTTRQLLLSAWSWNVLLIAGCVAALFFYAILCRLKFSSKTPFYIAGVALFFIALDSPISFLAKNILFSAHMIQHLLLVLIVPPLILLGLPHPSDRRDLFRLPSRLKHPLVAWLCGVGVMWFWHVPSLCDAAASNELIHTLQIFSLLFLGMLFWRPILDPRTEERLSPLAGTPYLFTACMACTLLGIWITFSTLSTCPIFMAPAASPELMILLRDHWHLTPAVDQQIGGLMMWVPSCLVYLGAILFLLGRLYRHSEGPLPSPLKKRAENESKK